MEQKKKRLKKCSILGKNKSNRTLIDYMQKHPELTPVTPSPPPDEFQKIMAEMDRRGVKCLLRRQLSVLHYCRRLAYHVHKPFLLSMVVCVLLAATSIHLSSEKANQYRCHSRKSLSFKEAGLEERLGVLCYCENVTMYLRI